MAKLQQKSFQILERPNYGYDFGGYRDGVLHILEQGVDLHNLFVMNDSVWLPVHRDSDPVFEALNSSDDLYGISYFEHLRKPHLSHVQSYFFRFGPKILSDDFFIQVWRELPLSNIRNTVIRKCEMCVTEAFRSRGFSVGTWSDMREVNKMIGTLSDQELNEMVDYLSNITLRHKEILKSVRELRDKGKDWRSELERLIEDNSLIIPFLIHWPGFTFKVMNIPVLKKDRSEPYRLQRSALKSMNFKRFVNTEIASEIETWDDFAGT